MRAVQLGAFIGLLLTLAACGSQGDRSGSDRPSEMSEQISHEAHPPGDQHGLSLNGTEKWQMDAHTRSMFAKMAATFADDGGTGSPESVKTIGQTIRDEIDELIQGCTMTGEAHDQLHKYLMVYIPAVEEMAGSGTKANADRVGDLLKLYPTYFE